MTDRIRKLRVERGISQENVAVDLGITPSAYAKIERGETDPNLERLFEIATIFEVPVIDFFTDPVQAVNEPAEGYGTNVKEDIQQLTQLVQQVLSEMNTLKTQLSAKDSSGATKKGKS